MAHWPRLAQTARGSGTAIPPLPGDQRFANPAWQQRPFDTHASCGIEDDDELPAAAAASAPEHHLVDIDDVGELVAFLVSDGACRITGTIIPVDGGQHLIA